MQKVVSRGGSLNVWQDSVFEVKSAWGPHIFRSFRFLKSDRRTFTLVGLGGRQEAVKHPRLGPEVHGTNSEFTAKRARGESKCWDRFTTLEEQSQQSRNIRPRIDEYRRPRSLVRGCQTDKSDCVCLVCLDENASEYSV
jgi:hypothetical protein